MPRILTCVSPTLAVSTIVTFGIKEMKSLGRSMPACSITRCENALIAIGTSCRLSERFRAVTITSSSSAALVTLIGAKLRPLAMSVVAKKKLIFLIFKTSLSFIIE